MKKNPAKINTDYNLKDTFKGDTIWIVSPMLKLPH